MENMLSKVISELTYKINSEKERLINLRIKERVRYDFDLIEESKRRFSRLKIERHSDQSEHYYWDNGTADGLHLISFYQETELGGLSEGKIVSTFTFR